jgi:hypothetical protein
LRLFLQKAQDHRRQQSDDAFFHGPLDPLTSSAAAGFSLLPFEAASLLAETHLLNDLLQLLVLFLEPLPVGLALLEVDYTAPGRT